MIQTIKNLYRSSDLRGDGFIQPLRGYHEFFAENIERSSGCQKVAWRAGRIASGIFAYPFLGVVAGVGMGLKLSKVPQLRRGNESLKSDLQLVVSNIRGGVTFSHETHTSWSLSGNWRKRVVEEFQLTQENVDEVFPQILQKIDSFSDQFRRVCRNTEGALRAGEGHITVRLKVNVRDLLTPAAEGGDAQAQLELGLEFANPEESFFNPGEARRWFEMAAEQRNLEAQYQLGLLLLRDDHAQQANIPDALLWLRRAAEGGHAKAQSTWGGLLAQGANGTPDLRGAVHWYSRAADQEHAEAQYRLGQAYETGQGVPSDLQMALYFYQLAEDQGVDEARDARIRCELLEETRRRRHSRA